MNPALPLLVLATVVRAGDLPEVAVVGLHVRGVDAPAGTAASDRVSDALEGTGRVDVPTVAQITSRLRGRQDLVLADAFLGRGRALLEEGRILYERAEPDQAVPVLDQAVEKLSAGMAWTTDGRPLVEALLLSGCARLVAGDEPGARATWARVVVLDPVRELDVINFAPRMVDLYAAVRREVLAGGVGALDVTTDTPGAGVWVDGRRVGTTPVAVEGLPAGRHALLVVSPSGSRRFGQITIQAGGRTPASIQLQRPALDALSADTRDGRQQVEDLYRALGEHLDVDAILLAGIDERGSMALQLYAPRSRVFSRAVLADPGDHPVSAAVALAPQLVGALTAGGGLAPDQASPQVLGLDVGANPVLAEILLGQGLPVVLPTPALAPPRWPARRTLWTAAGFLGAGALLAGGVWLATSLSHDDGTISVGPIP